MVEEHGNGAFGDDGFAWAPGEETQLRATGAWLITFADLILLILTFFVMMYSMSSPRIDAWTSMIDGLSTRPDPLVAEPMPETTARYAIAPALVRHSANLRYLEAVLNQAIAEDAALAGLRVSLGDEQLVISLPGALAFAPGAVTPTAGGEQTLMALASVLSRIGNRVAVGGMATVAEAPDGDAWTLSLQRAAAVAKALRRAGYPDEPLIMGYGDGRSLDGVSDRGVDLMVLTGAKE